jgi:hypothetical protein
MVDMRTTSGSWRVAKDFRQSSGLDREGGGRLDDPLAGASLRFDEHEFKAKSTYGSMPAPICWTWPITLAEMEPWYAKARTSWA